MGIPDIIIAAGDNILEMLPQKPPMVMVEKLHKADSGVTISSFTISSENIFCRKNKFEEPGLIENIAQTAALGVGYQFRQQGNEVPNGYIGAVQKLKINKLPEINKSITTEVRVVHEVFNTTLITASIDYEGEQIATCEMKIFLDK